MEVKLDVPTIFIDLGDTFPLTEQDLNPCYWCNKPITPTLQEIKFPQPYSDGTPSAGIRVDAINVPSVVCYRMECFGFEASLIPHRIAKEFNQRALGHPLINLDADFQKDLRSRLLKQSEISA